MFRNRMHNRPQGGSARPTPRCWRAFLLALAAGCIALPGRAAPLPDPTRPDYLGGVRHTAARPGWKVTATLISSGRRFAVVNGKTVAPGDTVDGARVLEILPYAVKLRVGGNEVIAYLLASDMKRPARHDILQRENRS